jgi:hypothetical protein
MVPGQAHACLGRVDKASQMLADAQTSAFAGLLRRAGFEVTKKG